MRGRTWWSIGVVVAAILLVGGAVRASDCDTISVDRTPVDDLGAGLYLDQFEGGLYPGGLNAPPVEHAAAGRARAEGIRPRDVEGNLDADGKYVMISIGISNATQEFCSVGGGEPCDPWTFMGQAAVHPHVNDATLVIVNGASGGQAADSWESPAAGNYDRIRDQVLAPQGLSEAQVQIAWVKVANRPPTVGLPSTESDAYELRTRTGNIARALKVRYPNLRQVYLSSRIYAGYASTDQNPEPYAYESAFAMKWLIEAQIEQMAGGGIDPDAGDLNFDTVAPWLGWGAYLWADGLTPRSDGLTWECSDFQKDGTHPAQSGEEKVGTMLLQFFLTSPFSQPWFTRGDGLCERADLDGSGDVGVPDLLSLLAAWGACEAPCPSDLDGNGSVEVADLLEMLAAWGPCG